MKGIKRNLEKTARELLEFFPAIIILGARQTGKTTLAQQLKPDWKYLDLDRPSDFEQISRDPEFFFSQYPSHIIIDEAQNYPALFKVLRGVIDRHRDIPGRFIITGSSSPDLLKESTESLAGRVALLELGTLKANEYYKKPLSSFYNIFTQKLSVDALSFLLHITPPLTTAEMQVSWLKGGYPEPLLKSNESFYSRWMEAYRDTYIQRDIAALFPRLNRISYQRFLTLLCQLSGTILNKRDIARAIEMSEKTVAEYLWIAEKTYLWRNLPSYEGNPLKAVSKMPKGHVRDMGLMHYGLNIHDFDELFQSFFLGHSFEAFVIEEIIKGLQATNIVHWNSYYYRTRDGAEIDLILDGPFGCLPIEIKCGINHPARQLLALKRFIDEMNAPFGIIIDQSEVAEWLAPKILKLPVGWL